MKKKTTGAGWVRRRLIDGKVYEILANGKTGKEVIPHYDPIKANSPAAFAPDEDVPLLTMRELKQFKRVQPPKSARGKDVAVVRRSLRMSQAAFADVFDLPVATIRDWEAKRREPDQAAKVLLRVIAAEPKLVQDVVAKTRTTPSRASGTRKRAA
jgi:DNA-binding transcriptional regulator YiaG